MRRAPALLAALLLVGCQRYPSPDATRAQAPAPIAISAQSIALPAETAMFPPGAEIVAVQCSACHSPELILTQPQLTAAQWQAEIVKMRGAYKASIAERDDPRIVAALLALQSAQK